MVQLLAQVIQAAQLSHKNWKVPASVSLAQYGLESAWGKTVTGKYNFFGIKAVPGDTFTTCPTHEVVHGKRVLVLANFKNFRDYNDAFDYHAKLLATHERYAPAMEHVDNAEAFAHALTGLYATDPDYGNKLVEIMQQSQLERYDA